MDREWGAFRWIYSGVKHKPMDLQWGTIDLQWGSYRILSDTIESLGCYIILSFVHRIINNS